MADYIISACSTADLTKEQFEKHDIKYIYFHYSLDGVMYPDDLGQTISFDDFYQKMEDGAETATSQINPDEFIEFFTPYLEEGKDVIHCTLSSGISGVHNSALIARDELQEKYPDRKIIVIDSLCAATGYGMLMVEASKKKAAGATIDEVAAWIEEHKLKMEHWLYVSDLKYLVKGGRVSKTSGFIGNMLNICPVISVDAEGKLAPREKIRGKKKAAKRLVEKMVELADGGVDYSGSCWLSMSASMEDAEYLKKLIQETFPKIDGEIVINSIGTVIGSHTGPGTVVTFFWGKEDRV
ncbi:MAG: DegV family protein [Lachnospiraceae bacterium]|nr:DegV family protein [Lachnospiraceae bacterium]